VRVQALEKLIQSWNIYLWITADRSLVGTRLGGDVANRWTLPLPPQLIWKK